MEVGALLVDFYAAPIKAKWNNSLLCSSLSTEKRRKFNITFYEFHGVNHKPRRKYTWNNASRKYIFSRFKRIINCKSHFTDKIYCRSQIKKIPHHLLFQKIVTATGVVIASVIINIIYALGGRRSIIYARNARVRHQPHNVCLDERLFKYNYYKLSAWFPCDTRDDVCVNKQNGSVNEASNRQP